MFSFSDAEDFEPADPDQDKAKEKVVATDKWEGEDEEEDVKVGQPDVGHEPPKT